MPSRILAPTVAGYASVAGDVCAMNVNAPNVSPPVVHGVAAPASSALGIGIGSLKGVK